jgi:hypothetical protein
MEAIAKMEGVDTPLKYYETQCIAQGADQYIVVIEPDTGFE